MTDLESARRLIDEGSLLVDLRSTPAAAAVVHPLESDERQGGWVLLLADSYEEAQAYADRLLAGKPVLAVRNARWQPADPRDE